ncbi:hypothetical protein IMCC9480_493 [Oxalobacteraceae bacterium IMCC9480]|nr:hypothetical protein IMCC9480_493 [Oxalobacteraceae bacterium IMCC9480]
MTKTGLDLNGPDADSVGRTGAQGDCCDCNPVQCRIQL